MTVPFVLLALFLVGCSSSRPTTTPAPDQDTTATTQASSSESKQEEKDVSAPSRAPQDWYHLDQVPRSGPGLDTRTAYQTVLENRAPQDTVRVAIIDSGFDIDHEDLSGKMWTNADEVPGNEVDDDVNPLESAFDRFVGRHVAHFGLDVLREHRGIGIA